MFSIRARESMAANPLIMARIKKKAEKEALSPPCCPGRRQARRINSAKALAGQVLETNALDLEDGGGARNTVGLAIACPLHTHVRGTSAGLLDMPHGGRPRSRPKKKRRPSRRKRRPKQHESDGQVDSQSCKILN